MINQISINNSDRSISISDIEARIEVLEEIEGLDEQIDNLIESEEATELVALRELLLNAEGEGDTLIRYNYWRDYVRDELYADDNTHDMPSRLWDNINWQGVADDEGSDHTTVDFDGITYYVV